MKRSSWTRTKVRGLTASMEKPMLAKEERKEASLGATRKTGNAGNGKMKANAPEEKTVHGRHLILKTRREAVPGVPTRTRTLAIPTDNLEQEADQRVGGSPRSGGKVHDKDVGPRQMAQRTNLPAAPS